MRWRPRGPRQPAWRARSWVPLSVAVVVVAALALPPAGAQTARPRRIDLPRGFQPEGIATSGNTFYTGSVASGSIFSGDLLTGEGSMLVPARRGRSFTGMKVAGNQLFVSGAATGKAFVFDAVTGDRIRGFRLAERNTFINDVIVTGDDAWFTDSFRPRLYRIPLQGGGSFGTPRRLPLSGGFRLREGFNLNGITTIQAPRGLRLLAVQSNTGRLFKINPDTGLALGIPLRNGRKMTGGDGLLLENNRDLWVVRGSKNVVNLVRFNADFSRGRVVERISRRSFDVPTTAAASGPWLAVVNARFGVRRPARSEYWISQFIPARP